jgi:hypothetical protein
MSLQLIAKQMEAKGRNGDSVLVHMTPGEVAGLQKLAESAGGSLSVNPETGLVEANFLKRMLPTLVGLGVGAATMNPYAGAAAGAAVGGMQAKQNDQDFLTGAALGGLGGYGGASMGAGLTAAGGATAAPLTASQGLSQAGQGISALGTEAGRGAFMQGVGGGAGLASDVGMAAAPMMAPGEAPGEAPVDDEMYVYDFDYGRTGADRMPTDSSAERTYFQPTYSNRRKIKAADYFNAAEGGLMSLAEGGSTAAPSQGMTGGSAAAFDYLMGAAPSSAGLSSMAMQAPAAQAPMADSGKMYTFNPATGAFARNPNFVDPEVAAQAAKDAAAAAAELERQRNSGGGSDGGSDYSMGMYSGHDYSSGLGTTNANSDVDTSYGYGGYFAEGGLMGLAKGGMKSGGFVFPADALSALGNGSTDAGLRKLNAMMGGGVTLIKGNGDGLSDSIPTNIDGKQPARVADGEAYIDPAKVKEKGGAKVLYALMDKVRKQAHGKTTQQRKVNPGKVMA